MQLAGFIYQVAIHRRVANATAVFAKQQAGFGLVISILTDDFITRYQVHCVFAPLFRGQAVTRAAEEDPCASGADLHRPVTVRTWNTCRRGIVGLHATGLGLLSLLKTITKITIETI